MFDVPKNTGPCFGRPRHKLAPTLPPRSLNIRNFFVSTSYIHPALPHLLSVRPSFQPACCFSCRLVSADDSASTQLRVPRTTFELVVIPTNENANDQGCTTRGKRPAYWLYPPPAPPPAGDHHRSGKSLTRWTHKQSCCCCCCPADGGSWLSSYLPRLLATRLSSSANIVTAIDRLTIR